MQSLGKVTAALQLRYQLIYLLLGIAEYWVTFGTVSSFFTTFTICGSFWKFSAIFWMAAGMVAENITVWRSSGSWLKMVSISSKKPLFSISSASSKKKEYN